MTTRPRRSEALTRDRIVEVAVGLLDARGEGGLTFRALADRLATGPGAIYWHVANKDELLDAATDAVVAAVLAAPPADSSPRERIRTVALRLFDEIDRHPWVATQLSRNSWQVTAPRLFEGVGRQVEALGVPRRSWFTATSALVGYVLGTAAQNAANARRAGPNADRATVLGAAAAAWADLDPTEYPFARSVADQLRDHDDRDEFLAGIDLLLAGIGAVHPVADR